MEEGGRFIMDGDGSNSAKIPDPGGAPLSHMGFKSDGTEFVNAQNHTSYIVSTGGVGSLDDLRNTTTMMDQLLDLGYEDVPVESIPGQGGMGTFALSVDWSRDDLKLVFDALLRDPQTDEIEGIGILVYEIAEDELMMVHGPEPFNGDRTNSFSYSVYTPKWIPSEKLSLGPEQVPSSFSLRQNHPNPFNPVTTLQYDLPQRSYVTLTIYDILGRQVRTLVQSAEEPGYKSVLWDAANDLGQQVSAGVYLYRIQAGEFNQTRKMVLIRDSDHLS